MNAPSKIIVAVTGASGSVYARMVVETLLKAARVTEIALIFSTTGREVMEYEQQQIMLSDTRITLYDNSDMFAPVASGSAGFETMIVVPCSMGCVGRIASGVSSDLISRAADVMLKERRPLLLVTRETPLSTIHLRNMTTLSECGAMIVPASPSFYSLPEDMDTLCHTFAERVVSLCGVDIPHFKWGER